MNKEDFSKVVSTLEDYSKRMKNVKELCYKEGKIFLDDLTLKQLKQTIEESRNLISQTDQFLKSDLYHLIGMGNLNVTQLYNLSKLTKNITKYRSINKVIACADLTLPKKIEKEAEYSTSIKGLKLVKDICEN